MIEYEVELEKKLNQDKIYVSIATNAVIVGATIFAPQIAIPLRAAAFVGTVVCNWAVHKILKWYH